MDWQIKLWHLWLKYEDLYVSKSWWKSCIPLYHTNHKTWRRLCYGVGDFAKVRDLHQVKSKLNQTSYHSIHQQHVIPSRTQLVAQGFVLMQDNDPNYTSKLCQRYIKNKEEQHVLQLMSWTAQSADLNPIELVWDELDQPTSAAHLW